MNSKVEDKAESLYYLFRDDKEFCVGWEDLPEEKKSHYRLLARRQLADQIAEKIMDLM